MNPYTQKSITLANTDCYLDRLFTVYPVVSDVRRNINNDKWDNVVKFFNTKDDSKLVNALLDLELFPIKDPYIRYLKKDRESITRNPQTIKRLALQIRKYNLQELHEKCTESKESNRQMGQLFNNWIKSGVLNVDIYQDIIKFKNATGNRCFVGSDEQKRKFVQDNFNHTLDKGLDLLVVFNGRFVLGEAKLITDFGGHQQTQFNDAMRLLSVGLDAIRIAILDGVIFINKGNTKMQTSVRTLDSPIMSALVLREYLESL